MKTILGYKKEMTQKWTDAGLAPVTVVQAGPCVVTQVKGEKDGYQALQLGFYETKKKLSQSLLGHLKGLKSFRVMREFRTATTATRGQICTVASFKPGDIVQVTGTSKGKGFQGVVKRHHFGGSPKTHGHKDQLRMPGSIGATEPKHVFKGTRMAGRMGGDQVTVKHLEIIEVDEKNNLLYIKGALPGARNGLLIISGDGDMTFVDQVEIVAEPTPASSEASDAPSTEGVVKAEESSSPDTAEEPVSDGTPEATETPSTETPAPEDNQEKTT